MMRNKLQKFYYRFLEQKKERLKKNENSRQVSAAYTWFINSRRVQKASNEWGTRFKIDNDKYI